MDGLIQAIKYSDIDEIQRILSKSNAKQLVNATDKDLYNSLFHTVLMVQNQQTALTIFNILLEKGVDPYHKDQNKQTIIFYLSTQGKAKIIEKMLQAYKYNLNEVDTYQQTPLFYAAKYNKLKAAEVLVRYGVNVNHQDQYQETCLFFAAAQGHLQMCKFLINRGCQHDLVDGLKKTPLTFAKTGKHTSVVEYLISLKEQNKKIKQKQKEKQFKEVSEQKKRKKEVIRNEYVLVYTNDQGSVHEMSMPQIQEFKTLGSQNQKLYKYMNQPQLLDQVESRHQKKFIKVATKIINMFLKRPDLFLFHAPVNVNDYPDYPQYVLKPMDFGTIKTKVMFNCYQNQQQFKNDIYLVYQNCIRFNGADSPLGKISAQLRYQFDQIYKKESVII